MSVTEHCSGFISEHHIKSDHEIYGILPGALCGLLHTFVEIEVFSIGGSYAKGTYQWSDDIDLDVLFRLQPTIPDMEDIRNVIEYELSLNAITADIRALLSRELIDQRMIQTLYDKHPDTPYVARSSDVARAWGLSS